MATSRYSARTKLQIIEADLMVEPLLGDGGSGPVEITCWRDFFTSYGTTDPSALADPIRRLRVRTTPDRDVNLSFEVRPTGPAVHVFALAEVGNYRLYWQMAARTEQGYVFAGTYCSLPPTGSAPGWSRCYHIRCVPLRTDLIKDQAGRIIKQDVTDFLAGRVTPAQPRIGNHNPIAVVCEERLADGGASLRRDLRTGTVAVTVESPSERTREEIDGAVDFLKQLKATLPVHRGCRPEHLPEEMREAYKTLLPRCEALLEQLRDRPRAPSSLSAPRRRRSVTLRVLNEQFRGLGLDEADLANVSYLLTSGRRRPSPAALATNILAGLTGSTERNVRRLLRTK